MLSAADTLKIVKTNIGSDWERAMAANFPAPEWSYNAGSVQFFRIRLHHHRDYDDPFLLSQASPATTGKNGQGLGQLWLAYFFMLAYGD